MVDPSTYESRGARPARDSFMKSLQRKWAMKIGRIEDLLLTPCYTPLGPGTPKDGFLWVTAFFAGIPQALVTLNTHDCSDNLWDKNKQLWGPKAPRGGGRHGRRGTPSNQATGGLAAGTGPARGWQAAAFKFGDIVEKIGAKLMIIDAALDLAINWQSFYLEWTGCGAPPAVFTSASVTNNVVGVGASDVRSDMAGHPGSVGIFCGIGGFATTVPVGQLEMAGSVPDLPFLFIPYEGLGGTYMLIDAVSPTDKPQVDQRLMTASTDAGANTSGFRASFQSLGAVGRTGSVMLIRPTSLGHACQVDPSNIITIQGSTEGLLTADPKSDPCSNLPLTGTAPRTR